MADEELPQVFRTYKYRLFPTKRQHAALADILESQRQLYNAALESRIDYYRKIGKSLSYMTQTSQLAECRRDIPEMAVIPSNLQRATLKRLDRAFDGFFRRVKHGDKAGFPRFKGRDWFTSFGFVEFSGIRLVSKRLKFKGLPGFLRVHLHRQLPKDRKICRCTFKKDARGWTVSFQVKMAVELLPASNISVGIDCGITDLAVLSNGEHVPNPRIAKRHERELRRHQRALSRCKKGSGGRRKARAKVARLHVHISNTRSTYLHQVSRKIVNSYGAIAVEKLNVKGLASSVLAKSVHDVAWGKFLFMLSYKALSAGREFKEVDPRYTSQICSGCGVIVKKKLSERVHNCPECGLVMDRDENAALNILRRAVVSPGALQRRESLACAQKLQG
jgi:putative transposase